MKKNLNQKPNVKRNVTAKWRAKPKGIGRVTNWVLRKLHAFGLISRKVMYELYTKGEVVEERSYSNVICNDGFEAVGKQLAGTTTGALELNYMAFGTGTGTPSASDSTLFSEQYRATTSSASASGNELIATVFISESEYPSSGSVTITEFGNFIEGSSSKDTGSLWTHIAGLSWTKDNSTSLTVDCSYVFSSK